MSKIHQQTSPATAAKTAGATFGGCSRREAIRAASRLTAGALFAGCGAPDELGSGVCMGTQPVGAIVATGAETLAEGKALKIVEAKKPIYVARDSRGFMALNATCTHEDCEAFFVETRNTYECNCHGSRYGFDGAVLMGPAQKPLSHVFICRNSDGLLVVQPDHVLSNNNGRIQ